MCLGDVSDLGWACVGSLRRKERLSLVGSMKAAGYKYGPSPLPLGLCLCSASLACVSLLSV